MPDKAKNIQSPKVVRLEPESQRLTRARLARLPAPVHAIHEKAKQLLAVRLKTFFDRADDSLFELADKAHSNQEQNLFFDSMREVRVQRRGIEKRFIQMVDEAFATLAAVDRGGDESVPVLEDTFSLDDTLNVDALSLVNNDDLEEMVAMESTVSRANTDYGEAVQQISLRLDSLVPIKVYQKNNPIGPDVLCASFMAQAKKLDVDIKAKLVLFKLFDKVVIGDLGSLYSAINQLLIDNNVLPSLSSKHYRQRQNSTTSNNHQNTGPTVTITAGSSGGAGGQVNAEVLATLQNLFGDQLSANAQAQANVNAGNALLSLLSFAQKLPVPATRSAAGIDVRGLLDEIQRRKGVNAQIGRVDEETINLVNMLFDFILEDRNLALPMKALISRMQIPIVKVAIVDKTFFTRGGHPARRLLNEMASAAMGWQGDPRSGESDPLYKKMDDVVRSLLRDFETDVSIFTELLADFTSFVDKEKRRSAVLERRTIDAEDGKAKAEIARTTVALEVELRTINERVPEVVTRLISEAWNNVLFVVALKHGYQSEEWKSNLQTLEELIWSVKTPTTDEDRKKLIQLVPELLKKLRAGFDTISFNPFEMSDLFKSLEDVHLACIRGKIVRPAQDEDEDRPMSGYSAAVKPKPTASAGQPAARAEVPAQPTPAVKRTPPVPSPAVNEALRNLEADVSALTAQAPAKEEEELPPEDQFMRQVANFVQGAWFEMTDDKGTSTRSRLAAFIKPTGKYIFVNRNGMKVAEKTQNELALGLKHGKVRALDNSMLFDRALETVVTSLRKPNN